MSSGLGEFGFAAPPGVCVSAGMVVPREFGFAALSACFLAVSVLCWFCGDALAWGSSAVAAPPGSVLSSPLGHDGSSDETPQAPLAEAVSLSRDLPPSLGL